MQKIKKTHNARACMCVSIYNKY